MSEAKDIAEWALAGAGGGEILHRSREVALAAAPNLFGKQ
jgi:hypothetical protein